VVYAPVPPEIFVLIAAKLENGIRLSIITLVTKSTSGSEITYEVLAVHPFPSVISTE
jgi:hypothetical protein